MDESPSFPQPPAAPGVPAPASAAAPRRVPWYSWRRWGWNFLTLSLLAHLLFGLGAAYYIVAIIQGKPKQQFQPPGAKGPNAPTRAMEHKVQMAKKQSSMSAPVAAKRITTTSLSKVALPALPAMKLDAVVLPATMSGMGGTGAGLGGFGNGSGGGGGGGGGGLTFFGIRSVARANAALGLAGTFYDLKQNKERGPTGMTPKTYAREVTYFLQGGWGTNLLSKYFQGPETIYAQQVFVPNITANLGPAAFGLEKLVQPRLWLVHYKGNVSPTVSGTYHFVGAGDDVMNVRFGNRLVLSRNYDDPKAGVVQAGWHAQTNYDYHWPNGGFPGGFAKGDAITVTAGSTYPMEVLIGEQPGGRTFAALLIEKDGETYQKDSHGNPLLPVFRLTQEPLPERRGNEYAPHAEQDGPVWKSVAKEAGPKSIFSP